ncbi:hypothetical protein [Spongiimicrobium salis]|uniref:hypothetical protein n=1 Tax=Spongiimicrobium salis TaxID=1667022 RepID=UPI00374D05C9
MIVWSGRGYVAVIVLLLSLFIAFKIVPETHKDLGFALGFLVTGVCSWILGNKWNTTSGRRVVDKRTGEEIILKGNHSLFWIKLQYWGIVFGVLTLVFLIKNFL